MASPFVGKPIDAQPKRRGALPGNRNAAKPGPGRVRVNISLMPEQRKKLKALGASRFVQGAIDAAPYRAAEGIRKSRLPTTRGESK